MNFRESLTRKNIFIASSVFLVGLVVAGFFVLRRPARVAMERYVSADALAFVEVDSLSDVIDGLTSTKAWRELAPVLGLSSQLKQVGFVADLIGRSGLGPDEAVIAGRAQYAVAITGIESKAGETDEGAYLHLKPDFALIVETHMKPETAARLVRERASIIAQRIYGESVAETSEDYRGSQVLVFQGPEAARQMLASSFGSVVLIANQPDAIKRCLDAVAGRAATLADDATLKQMRPEVDRNASVFGYVTKSGIQKVAELSPVLIANRASSAESLSLFVDLIEHLSNQAGAGLLYSSAFETGGVTEKYLTVLRPQVAEALSGPLKAASAAGFESPALIPCAVESVTFLNVERAGELPERVLKQLSPTVDIVAGVALREFVIDFRKQYGLGPSDSVGDAAGSEIALINFGDEKPRAMLIRVNDRARLTTAVSKYLARNAAPVSREQVNGIDVLVSSDDERRAAAFVGDFLALGTRDQISKIIDTQASRDGLDGDERFKRVLASRPENASILWYRPRVGDAGRLLLAISKLTRVTDGSPELLERDSARNALGQLAPSTGFTEFRSRGIYTESHSAVGSFSVIAALME